MQLERGYREPRAWDPFGYPLKTLRSTLESSVDALDLQPGSRILDFGCGEQPYRALFGPGLEYVGADLPGVPGVDVVIEGGRVDLPDRSMDVVLSSQVLEHVPDPGAYLAECRRVLKPGGKLVLSTHGIMFHHPHPHDFWRWSREGLTRIVDDAGLKVGSLEPVMGAVATGLWLMMINVQARLPRGLRQAFVSVMNLLISWVDGGDSTYEADFVYVVVAEPT